MPCWRWNAFLDSVMRQHMQLSRFLPSALVFSSVLVLSGILAGCDGMLSADAGRGRKAGPQAAGISVARDELPRLGLRELWSDKLQLPEHDRVQQVTMLGQQLVVVTERNFCYAIDTYTGDYRPLTEIAPQQTGPFKSPFFDGFHFFFAGTKRLVGINAATGKTEIQITLDMPSNVRAISDREFVYTGALDGKIFAYSIESQQKHWEGRLGPAVVSLQFCRGNLVAARSDVLRGRGEVFMIAAKRWNDEPLWTTYTQAPISAPIVATAQPDEAIFVASEDSRLYRLNAQHGWPDWELRTPAPLVDSPLVLEEAIVQIVPGHGTWVVDRMTSEIRWKDSQTLQYLGQSADKTRMYFFDGKNILAKKPQDGKTLGSLAVEGAKIMTVPNPDDTRLYLLNAAGSMICLDESKLPYQAVE